MSSTVGDRGSELSGFEQTKSGVVKRAFVLSLSFEYCIVGYFVPLPYARSAVLFVDSELAKREDCSKRAVKAGFVHGAWSNAWCLRRPQRLIMRHGRVKSANTNRIAVLG
nr:hypothetical protein [Tanacetum cinerariifolium]